MSDYLNQQKTLYRDLGRRKGQSESVPNPNSDLALFNRVRIDKGPEFDEAEAAKAIGLLTRQRVTKCEREGETYRVTLVTVFGETQHVVNIPFEKDLAVYRRNVFKTKWGQPITHFPKSVPGLVLVWAWAAPTSADRGRGAMSRRCRSTRYDLRLVTVKKSLKLVNRKCKNDFKEFSGRTFIGTAGRWSASLHAT